MPAVVPLPPRSAAGWGPGSCPRQPPRDILFVALVRAAGRGGSHRQQGGAPEKLHKDSVQREPALLSCSAGGGGGEGEAVGQPRAVSPRAGLLEGRDVGLTWQLLRQHEPQWEARNAFPDSSSSTPTGRLGAGTSHPWLPAVLPEIRDF